MRKVVLLLLLGIAFGIDLKNPQGEPADRGRSLGNQFRDVYGGSRKGDKLKNKLLDPATSTQQNVNYTLPKQGGGEQNLSGRPVLCGQGEVKEEKPYARVSISTGTTSGSVSVQYASDPYTGNTDRSLSYSGRYLCPKGYCTNYQLVGGQWQYTGCQEVYLDSGGIFRLRSVNSLDNCVDVGKLPQQPSFFVAYLQELLSYYQSAGKPITVSKVQENGWNATFYGGKAECEGVNKNPPQTQYYKNPYVMNDHALYYYFTCDPERDSTCRAVKGFMEGSVGGDSTNTCVISREINTSPTFGRTDDRICTPGAKLYPDGYSDRSTACFSGDRFFNYSSFFWLECNPDGKGFTLKGWGFWEGAPCGRTEPFPPKPQVEVLYRLDQNIDWVEIGRLSVNRRRGGEGLSSSDRATPQELQCVSDEPTPYRVWLKNTFIPSEPRNILEVRVDNAPACNRFTFSQVKGLIGERLGDCDQYERQGCKVINEWWVDAQGNRIQVIKDGRPVAQLAGCTEILRDENQKVWASHVQTTQAPPQNCNYPPKTCRVISGQTECRQWWQKIREYRCVATKANANPDLSSVGRIMSSTDYNPQTGELKWSGANRCSGGTCTPVVSREGRFVCPVNGENYPLQSACNTNCYEQVECNQELRGYRCSRTGALYPTPDQCQSQCREQAPCNTVYVCPLNGQRYDSQSACLSGCGNCEERGTCSQVNNSYWLCSANNQRYSDSNSCQSACTQQGTCNQEYYCTQGTLSGTNCVIQPSTSCPAGYTFPGSGSVCTANPQCSLGSYNSQRDRCEVQPTCPSGYTWNASRGRCETQLTCPSGFSWNASRGRCERQPDCPPGAQIWNNALKRCEAYPICPSGYTWSLSRYRCEATPSCPSPGSWNWSTGRCEASTESRCVINSASCNWYHPSAGSYFVNLSCSYSPCVDASGSTTPYISGSYVQLYCRVNTNSGTPYFDAYYYIYSNGENNWTYDYGWSCSSQSRTLYVYVYSLGGYATVNFNLNASYQNVCPSGYTLSGGVCVANPVCLSGGTYDSTNRVCFRNSTSCPSGFTYDSVNRICYASPTCSSGTYDSANGVCWQSTTCPSGSTYDSANGVCFINSFNCPSGTTADTTNRVCFASATCPSGGSLNPSTDRCEVQANLSCPSGWTLQNGQCVQPAQSRFRCSLNGQTYSDQSQCQSACRQSGTCSQQTETVYRCSLGGDFSDMNACSQNCRRNLPNCCQAQGFCTGDNQIYPADTCSSQCFRRYSCDAVYWYRCPVNSMVFEDSQQCSQNCRRYQSCTYQTVDITRYLCSRDMTYYESAGACQNACSGGGCSQYDGRAFVGTAEGGWEEGRKCLQSETKYCIVRQRSGGKNSYDTRECNGDVCPAGGGEQVVEGCKCASEMKMGFGIATSTLNVIYEALRDRTCGQ